jgi:hypothetical protein
MFFICFDLHFFNYLLICNLITPFYLLFQNYHLSVLFIPILLIKIKYCLYFYLFYQIQTFFTKVDLINFLLNRYTPFFLTFVIFSIIILRLMMLFFLFIQANLAIFLQIIQHLFLIFLNIQHIYLKLLKDHHLSFYPL